MKKLKALLVEDDPNDIMLLQRKMCFNETHLFSFDVAANLKACAKMLKEGDPYDIVFLDLGLPESNGIETVKKFLELECDMPIVILTGSYDEAVVDFALNRGVQDYIVKSRVNSENIIRIVEYSVTRHRLQAELYSKMKEVEHKSLTILDKTYRLLKLIKDMEKPLTVCIKEGEELAGTSLEPEQKNRLHKMVLSVGVIKAIIDELEDEESLAAQHKSSQSTLDRVLENTDRLVHGN